jgi:hypothetical protein
VSFKMGVQQRPGAEAMFAAWFAAPVSSYHERQDRQEVGFARKNSISTQYRFRFSNSGYLDSKM